MPKNTPQSEVIKMSYYYVAGLPCSNELYHHGILGQKWGVRRFQNRDGSLTPAGRERYGSGSEDSFGAKAKKMATNAGRAAARTAKAATSYTAKRTKMKHPSLMTDEELRTYTQRLIAEKNYSDLLRYQRQNSGLGKAKAYVGDILKRGGTTLADAGFRRIANRIAETEDDRALRKLKAQKAKDELENLQETRGNEEAQKQQREIEKLQREKQLNDLRNNVDSETVDMQRKINQLQQQKQLKDLEKQLDPNKNGGGLSEAMRIIGNPDGYSSAEIKKAQELLKDYSSATNFINNIRKNNMPISTINESVASAAKPAEQVANPVVVTAPAQAATVAVDPKYENMTRPSSYTPQSASSLSTRPDYNNFKMRIVDDNDNLTNRVSGMYDGALNGYRMQPTEQQSQYYTRPTYVQPVANTTASAPVSAAAAPSWTSQITIPTSGVTRRHASTPSDVDAQLLWDRYKHPEDLPY